MRAALVEALGKPPTIAEMPDPTAGDGESVVRIRAAAVSHLDLQLIRGEFSIRPRPPLIGGTEGSGEIVSSTSFDIGTAVRIRGAGIGIKRPGTWAELVAVPDAALTRLDVGGGHWELAASFFSPAVTAWAALHDVAGVQPDERVAVTGATGAVGTLTVQLAAQHGCETVGIVGSAGKRPLVPDVATSVAVFDAATGALTNASGRPADDGPGTFDVVIDTVGGGPLAAALSAVRPGGRAALVGYTAGDHIDIPISRLLLMDVSLLPTNLLRRGPSLVDRADELLAQLVRGDLVLPVTSLELTDFAAAAAAVGDRSSVGRVVVIP